MNVDKIQEGLQTKKFGKTIILLRKVDSTNNFAKKLARYGAFEGTVVVAEEQTAGRGRHKRKWFSPKGGLYFSVILRPKFKVNEAVGIVVAAGLAVVKVLSENYGLKVEAKWPNDVLLDGKKVCGILTEVNSIGEKVNYVVVGMGINVNSIIAEDFPEELQPIATSLKEKLKKKVALEPLLKRCLEKFEEIYEAYGKLGFQSIMAEWMKYLHDSVHIDFTKI
ncbi:MAG: biotin--[acetyl-CoA-carboxylase] ligase [Candidatus Bathyarchaeales archaeon]